MSAILIVLGLFAGAVDTWTLTTTDWPPPRRAEVLTVNAAVAALVYELDARPQSILRIRHAGGAAGSDFAQQLRDALVALGLPSARTLLVPAAADVDQLILEISVKGEMVP